MGYKFFALLGFQRVRELFLVFLLPHQLSLLSPVPLVLQGLNFFVLELIQLAQPFHFSFLRLNLLL
jgi:hypothetical protein